MWCGSCYNNEQAKQYKGQITFPATVQTDKEKAVWLESRVVDVAAFTLDPPSHTAEFKVCSKSVDGSRKCFPKSGPGHSKTLSSISG